MNIMLFTLYRLFYVCRLQQHHQVDNAVIDVSYFYMLYLLLLLCSYVSISSTTHSIIKEEKLAVLVRQSLC